MEDERLEVRKRDWKGGERRERDGELSRYRPESGSESSDGERGGMREEIRERDEERGRYKADKRERGDRKEMVPNGNEKGRKDDRSRNGRDIDSESDDGEGRRRERREKGSIRRREVEDGDGDDLRGERKEKGRRDELKKSDRDSKVEDSESSDGEARRRPRREREKRKRDYDDEKSDSDGRRKRDSRGERKERDRRDELKKSDKNRKVEESESSDGEARHKRRREKERKRRDYSDDESDSDRKAKRDSRRERKERDRRDDSKKNDRDRKVVEDVKQPEKKAAVETDENPAGPLDKLGKTGGVYVPPFKLARMLKEIEDKSSPEYQRLTWDALRKSINGLVNKVNATNIKNIIPELFSENLIRGRGLFCRSCMKSQMASPGFTDVFAALVAVVNTKFPEIGELLLRRIVLQLKRAFKRNDKPQLLAAVKFIAHLVNQQVANELVALELSIVFLDRPSDDSVEVAVDFIKECGCILQDLTPKGVNDIFDRFRAILHEGEIDLRVQYLIEGLFAIRKAKFQGHPAVRPELDLVEPEDQITHEITLEDEIDPETTLDIFRQDPNFLENERKYEDVKKSILGDESEDEDDDDDGSDEDEEEDEDEEDDEEQMEIKDATETNLVNLRRTIYLTIMSSVDFEEAGHKLLKIKLEPGQEMELCIMLLECCSQERTYLRYYGLLGQRFCMINKIHQDNFETCFVQQYSMIHRLETNKLRNVAKFFAHLLGTDALPWHVLSYIRLTEEDTTSSSRIFIKILFQELSEHLGIRLLNERLNDPSMIDSFESIFPKDNPRNTRFAINFFTSIGLGGLTENLREYLKNMPRMIMQQQKPESEDESDSDSGSGSSSSESSSSDSSSSDESDTDDDKHRKRRKRK